MTSQEAKEYVAELRKEHPHPVRARYGIVGGALARWSDPTIDCYCVGGAFAKYHGGVHRFPVCSQLCECIRRANNGLTSLQAHGHATDIIAHNDLAEFDEAWAALEKALTEEGTEP